MTDGEFDMTSRDPVEDLLAACLDRPEEEWSSALESACMAHPEHAEALRARFAVLDGLRAATPEQPARTTDAGTTIAHYRLVSELGRGGQAVVFLAEDERLRRPVALKVFHASLLEGGTARERYERETLAASRLDHPGLCPVYEADEIDGVRYIAMRYIDGSTVQQIIDREGAPRSKPELERRLAMVEGVARALHEAHEAGLVHRDIKPGNIMVDAEDRPVILDFGLARDETGEGATLTRTGDLLGTPAYMSPEQLLAQGTPLDRRTDVYSLGAVLYQCVTAARPFDAVSRDLIYHRILNEEPADPRRLNRAVSGDLAAVIQAAMEKNRTLRYPDALHLAEDLRALAEGRPLSVKPLSPVRKLVRRARRRPALATLIVVLVIGIPVLAAVGGFLFSKWDTIRAGEDAIERERHEELLEAADLELGERRYGEAVRLFERALDTRPDSVEAAAGLAVAHLMDGRAEQALASLERHRGSGVPSVGLERIRADCLRRVGRTAEAAAIEAELGEPRTALDCLVLTWRALASTGNRYDVQRRALDLMRQAVERSRRARLLYHVGWARAAALCHDGAAGRAAATALLDLWPESALGLFYAARAAGVEDEDRAIELLERSAARAPKIAAIWTTLAHFFIRTEQGPRALEAVARAIALDPDNSLTHARAGSARLACDDFEGAIESLRGTIARFPEEAEAHRALAVALRRSGRAAEALTPALEARRLDPDDPIVYHTLGLVYRELDRPDDALANLEESRRRWPGNVAASVNLAETYIAGGRADDAVAVLEDTLRGAPGSALALHQLGRARRAQGRRDEAVVLYRRALEIDPGMAVARRNLGLTLYEADRHEEAEIVYQDAIERGDGSPRAWFGLGLARHSLDDHEGALTAFRRATEIDPEYADAWCYVGIMLRSHGRFDEARDALVRGQRLGADEKDWKVPAAKWLADVESLIALSARLDGIRDGKASPESPRDGVALARAAFLAGLPRLATTLYAGAFHDDRRLLSRHRSTAICAAASLGCGVGTEGASADERRAARARALTWLHEEIARHVALRERGRIDESMFKIMMRWLPHRDTHLDPLRPGGDAKELTDEERERWAELWEQLDRHLAGPTGR